MSNTVRKIDRYLNSVLNEANKHLMNEDVVKIGKEPDLSKIKGEAPDDQTLETFYDNDDAVTLTLWYKKSRHVSLNQVRKWVYDNFDDLDEQICYAPDKNSAFGIEECSSKYDSKEYDKYQ